MSRIQLIDSSNTTSNRQALLEQVHKAFGATPNMFKAVANSPAALKSMWGSFGALGSGVLGAKLGEQIAVAIADKNRCEYCLAAHTVLGKGAGATGEEMSAAQAGQSADPKTAAALTFALKVVSNRAQVSNEDVAQLRSAGFDDEHIVEILAHVALNIFTNYVNVAFDVPLDFPKVALNAAV
nr:peroxidase-related enzyme [uncultured Undibacterium sp.]